MNELNCSVRRKLSLRLFVSLFLLVVLGFAAVMLLQFLLSPCTSPVAVWLYWQLDVVYFFYCVLGMACLFYYCWQKPWHYLGEVVSAAQTVYEQNSRPVKLSEPLRETEQQLNQIKMSMLLSRQAAKEAEEKKDELVMYLAHDIRTPLTTVIGYLSLLDEAPDMPPEQQRKYVGIALDKAERLEALIQELFEVARCHSGAVPLHKAPVALDALLPQVVEEFYPALTARGNSVSLSVEEGLSVPGDAEKLARVFGNLMKNAAAYSDPNTAITISARREAQHAVIVFRNRGRTIPAAELAAVFEKFTRLDDARRSDTGGMGLGLSIAKELVELHGGEIDAHSHDETVTFTVTLPLNEKHPAS